MTYDSPETETATGPLPDGYRDHAKGSVASVASLVFVPVRIRQLGDDTLRVFAGVSRNSVRTPCQTPLSIPANSPDP